MRYFLTLALVFASRLLSAQCNPPVTIDPVPNLCTDEMTYQLTATPVGGVWSGNQVSSGGLITLSSLSGTQFATYTYSDSTCTDTVKVAFQVINGPSLSAGSDFSIACGNISHLNGAFISGPNNSASWSTADGHIVGSVTDMNTPIDEPGTYILTSFNSVTGCSRYDTVVCYPNLSSYPNTEITDTICQGDTLLGYTKSGNFYEKYDIGTLCDSFRVVHLTVLQPLRDTVLATTCAGMPVEGYSASGIYRDTFPAANGCDSIRVLDLMVLPGFATNFAFTTCDPAQAGVFQTVLSAANGCDSVVTTTVELLPAAGSSLTATVCAGESVEGYSASGIYRDTFPAANGCDSIRVLDLTALPGFITELHFTTCDPAQAGVFQTILSAANGCDSVVTTTVELLPAAGSSLTATVCAGMSVEGYSASGIYRDTFPAANGCDSIRVLDLMVLPGFATNFAFTTCDPAQAGVFQTILSAANGCDSVVTTTVELLPGFATDLHFTTCDPAQAGVFQTILSAANGCDSVVTTTVELLPGFATDLHFTTCDPAQAGVFQTILAAANGCDSVVTVTVELLPPPAIGYEIKADNGLGDGSITVTLQGGTPPFQFAWSTGDTSATIFGLSAGDYTLTLTDSNGCSALFSFTVPLSVGTHTPGDTKLGLTASPNPVRSGESASFTLAAPEAGEYLVSVFDAAGSLSQKFVHTHSGPVSGFALQFDRIGMYVVRVTDARGGNSWVRVAVQ